MAYTTVSELKKHLNIEEEFTDDDVYLLELISVAEMAVSSYCNGGVEEASIIVIDDVTYDALPKAVKQACLMLAAHLYINRTPIAFTNTTEIPYTLKFLLAPYRNYVIK